MTMSRRLAPVMAVLTLAAAGCGKHEKKGLPAAKDWQSPTLGTPPPVPPATGPTAGGGTNPHAGVPGAPPLTDEQMQGSDPHAGVPGAPPLSDEQMQAGGNPHAGVPGAPPLDDNGQAGGGGSMGGDPTMQLPPPAADRAIDPSKYLAGTVTVPAANQAKIPVGAPIFMVVRPAAGGMPLAVDKLTATGTWPLAFRITEAQAMVGGTAFAGAVAISARFDQDGEARSKQPGDISGSVQATIPADGLVITLDQVQQ